MLFKNTGDPETILELTSGCVSSMKQALKITWFLFFFSNLASGCDVQQQ